MHFSDVEAQCLADDFKLHALSTAAQEIIDQYMTDGWRAVMVANGAAFSEKAVAACKVSIPASRESLMSDDPGNATSEAFLGRQSTSGISSVPGAVATPTQEQVAFTALFVHGKPPSRGAASSG